MFSRRSNRISRTECSGSNWFCSGSKIGLVGGLGTGWSKTGLYGGWDCQFSATLAAASLVVDDSGGRVCEVTPEPGEGLDRRGVLARFGLLSTVVEVAVADEADVAVVRVVVWPVQDADEVGGEAAVIVLALADFEREPVARLRVL